MPKNIVFCADGTWSHPHSPAMVEEADTNVYKLSQMVESSSLQRVFYDDGVGADGLPVARILGGAFGEGLFQKVKDGYTAIAHVYQTGDRIFIYGFSRGAYTARSVSGMITACGLPAGDLQPQLVNTAFLAYRQRDKTTRAEILKSLAGCNLEVPTIQVLGVWDTVGALGIPGALFRQNDDTHYGFLDTNLHPNVLNAFQALAIDERRTEFVPALWTSTPAVGQRIEQVWFTGAHSDVGGGYTQCGLSEITLNWMLQRSVDLGLRPIPAAVDASLDFAPATKLIAQRCALDQAHESWNVMWLIPQRRTIAEGSALGNSVDVRLQNQPAYRPQNLPAQRTAVQVVA